MPGLSSRRADIQGLRALAILLVVAYHAGLPLHGGFTGVDVFFVISGYVIAGTLLRELEATERIQLRSFYARRVRRLLPALASMLVVVAAAATLAAPLADQRAAALTGMFTSFYAANVELYRNATDYFASAATLNPLLHTWTLAVEEQFYLVFPALLLAGWWLGARSARRARVVVGLAVAAVSAGSFALALACSGGNAIGGIAWPQQFAFFGSPTRAWEFGAGALLALAPGARRLPRLLVEPIGAAGLAAVVAGGFTIDGGTGFPSRIALLPVLGTAALLVAGSAAESGVSRLLSLRPLAWIGDLSYSWYLWHWPFVVFGTALLPTTPHVAVAAVVVSLVPAWVSFRFVETPIRRSQALRGRTVVALAAACAAVPVAVCGGLLAVNDALASNPAVARWEAGQAPHLDTIRGCDRETAIAWCTWAVNRARGRVVLVGDSNAGQFSEPVTRAANRAGYNASLLTRSGCPFVDLVLVGRPDRAGCRAFVVDGVRELLRLRPSLVVMANRSDEYVESSSVGLAAPNGGAAAYSAARKQRLWQRGVRSIAERLASAGIPLLVVHPVPALFGRDIGSCAVVYVLSSSCPDRVARRLVAAESRRAVTAESRALAGIRDAWAISFDSSLCGSSSCPSVRGGTVMYRDPQHLSVAGALTLTGAFYREIVMRARPRDP